MYEKPDVHKLKDSVIISLHKRILCFHPRISRLPKYNLYKTFQKYIWCLLKVQMHHVPEL